MPATAQIRIVDRVGGGDGEAIVPASAYIDQLHATIKRQARQHYTLREAAQVLADAHEFDAATFIRERMRPAHAAGKLTVLDPKDFGPVTGRDCRDFNDIVTPQNINAWLAGGDFAAHVRWPTVNTLTCEPMTAPEQEAAAPAPVVAALEEVNGKAGPVFSMTKAAMLAQHLQHWPTINRDMKDAKDNGLDSAKAGVRGWIEVKALAWARANNKLKDTDKPADLLAQAMTNMGSLPGRRHTLKG